MRFIPLGRVARPFGIRGEVRINPYNPRTSWFEHAQGVWLRKEESEEPVYYPIVSARRHKHQIVLALAGVRDRNQAEELRGMEAVAPEDQLEPLGEDEYYWYQLVGLKVETAEGKPLGRVVRMEETAAELDGNDIFVVQGEEGELLLPATKEVVAEVDLEHGVLKVREVPGLTSEK